MFCQMWMSARGVRERRHADGDRRETGCQHRLNKKGPDATVQYAAFFAGYRYPNCDEPNSPSGNVQSYKPLKKHMGRHHYIAPPYCCERVGNLR